MTTNDDNAGQEGRGITQLIGVAQDGLELLRQEARLARQETIEKLTPAAQSVGMIAGGGMLAGIGSAYILQGLVRALATMMPHWLAALLSGVGFTAGGLMLMRQGTDNLKHVDLVPQKTIDSLKEDKEWLQHQIKSRLI